MATRLYEPKRFLTIGVSVDTFEKSHRGVVS